MEKLKVEKTADRIIKKVKKMVGCPALKTIQDVNDQYDYKDEIPGPPGDSKWVACGQDDESGHNELQYIYDTHLEKYVKKGKFTYKEAVKRLCEVCILMPGPKRERQKFYDKLGKKLGITIKP